MAWQGNTSPGFPPATRRQILRRDPTCRCPGCHRCTTNGCHRPSSEADHIIAWANGGTHDPTNGRGLCSPCHAVHTQHQAAGAQQRCSPLARRPAEPHPGANGHK